MGDGLWSTLAEHIGAAIAAVVDVTPAAAAGVEWQLRRGSENRHAMWPDGSFNRPHTPYGRTHS